MNGTLFPTPAKTRETMTSMIVKVFWLLLMTSQTRSFVTRSLPSHIGVTKYSKDYLYLSPRSFTSEHRAGRTLSDVDMEDILEGATLLGSGGGGSKHVGQEVLDYLLSLDDASVVLLDPNAGPSSPSGEEWVTTMAGIGSPSDAEKMEHPFSHGPQKAFDYLTELVIAQQKKDSGIDISKIDYVCPGEIGPWSTMITLLTAAQTNSPVIDADGGGRAYSNLNMTAYCGAGVSVNPMTLANDVDKDKDESVTAGFQVQTETIVESCTRALLSAPEFKLGGTEELKDGVAGFSTWAMTVDTLRNCMTANTISLAREIGETLRLTKAAVTTNTTDRDGDDPYVTNVIEVLKNRGWYSELLFTGTVENIKTVEQNSFDYVDIDLYDSTTGQRALIQAENENLIMYKCTDQECSFKTPICIGPDSICYLLENGTATTNVNLEKGMNVNVIGIQASPVLVRYPKVMEAFQTTLQWHFDYNGPYVPLEALNSVCA